MSKPRGIADVATRCAIAWEFTAKGEVPCDVAEESSTVVYLCGKFVSRGNEYDSLEEALSVELRRLRAKEELGA